MGLAVNNIPVEGRQDHRELSGWYISHVDPEGDYCAIPLCFARRCDAEAAMSAALETIDWEGSHSDVSQRVLTHGWHRLRQTMLERLPW